MPTLATGAEPRPARARPERSAGFTLVELMVVLVIMGLMASVALLAVGRPQPSLAKVAEQFGARLVRAQEEAILTNRPVGVAVTATGYAFRTRTAQGWAPLQDGPFKPVAWGEGVAAVTGDFAPGGQVNFEASGAAEPLVVTLTREARRLRVSVDAAGNVRIDAPA